MLAAKLDSGSDEFTCRTVHSNSPRYMCYVCAIIINVKIFINLVLPWPALRYGDRTISAEEIGFSWVWDSVKKRGIRYKGFETSCWDLTYSTFRLLKNISCPGMLILLSDRQALLFATLLPRDCKEWGALLWMQNSFPVHMIMTTNFSPFLDSLFSGYRVRASNRSRGQNTRLLS